MTDAVFFYLFSALVLGGAIFTVTRRFAVQIVLYVGGIMVLFLFVIMLVNLDQAAKERQFNRQWWIALLCVAAVGAEVSYFMRKGASTFEFAKTSPASATAAVGNTEQV